MQLSGTRNKSFLAAAGVFLIAKFKWVLALLKWSKFGGTFITMAASLATYAVFYGWKFAVALIYLIFVHEMGHVIAARRKGITTSPAVFIPFVGAFISMKDKPRDAATEAYLAYGGPLAGLISFLPAIGLYYATEDPFWALVIYLGALINLFNLIPVSPLDGGRIVSVLSSKIWFIGLAGLFIVVYFRPSPITILILIFGVVTWWNRQREGYRAAIVAHEKYNLVRLRDSIQEWPSMNSTFELKRELQSTIAESERVIQHTRKTLIPFIHDNEKLAREKAKLDLGYSLQALELVKQWEFQPVYFYEADPQNPAPSELLVRVQRELNEKLAIVNEQLERLSTYYEAPRSVKWKVLVAYLLLAAVLSAFAVYGHELVQQFEVNM
ncbi:site-2 protease family protein [Paenibacillus gansuensis]|uniref:Site-2 protease family protein n=1 Tax=Paenibacillus gansuensis TaxID=306542 RepID=A0ABW5P9D5_9BACL